MTDVTAPAIRFVNYMGDWDDYHTVNLIGPYPERAARDADLHRLAGLPLGAPEYHGGYQFQPATMAQARTGLDGRTVAPEQVAEATSVRGFFAAFHGWPDDEEDVQPAELPGQICLDGTEVPA